jgi:TolB-like protein
MRTIRSLRGRREGTRAVAAAAVAAALALPAAAGAADGSLGEIANATCDAYREQSYEQAIALSNKVLASPAADAPTKVDVYKCQACAYVAMRQPPKAKGSIAGMLTTDRTACFSPDYSYPPPVIDLYHTVRDSLFATGGGAGGAPADIRTVAVGDFEDNSIYTGKYRGYDFSLFRTALVHTVTADLAQATNLKIVDRQRTGQLLEEIKLGQSGFSDPTQAARAGQFLGAQTFIFGQYMVLSPKEVRIDARVVHTATGEVILTRQVTGDFGGDPKAFLDLERQLVESLAEGIEKIVAAGGASVPLRKMTDDYFARKAQAIGGRKAYLEGKFLAAEALEQEDTGDYAAAKKTWEKVLEVDPKNEVAAVRIQVLEAML